MLTTQNKGEWSEIFCMIKLLSENILKLCDENLNYTGDMVEILSGYLGSQNNAPQFFINDELVTICLSEASFTQAKLELNELAENILNRIASEQNNTFEIEQANQFLNKVNIKKIKSSSYQKGDLLLQINDAQILDNSPLAFSIKSFVGSSPTLINASRATNFTYKIGINPLINQEYFGIKSKDLVRKLSQNEIDIIFKNMDSQIYRDNLLLIDTNMPFIMSEAIKIYYSSTKKYVKEIAEELQLRNPLNLANTTIYESKIKDFSFYSNVGIFPNKPWNGLSNIDGGCIIVAKCGDLKSFYIIRKQYLQWYKNFLYNVAYFDTASNSRHGFGKLYENNGELLLKLNLQVRLKGY
jgi:type II restriction enzyme